MRGRYIRPSYDDAACIPVTELSQSTFIKHELDEWIPEWAPSLRNVKNEISQRNSCIHEQISRCRSHSTAFLETSKYDGLREDTYQLQSAVIEIVLAAGVRCTQLPVAV